MSQVTVIAALSVTANVYLVLVLYKTRRWLADAEDRRDEALADQQSLQDENDRLRDDIIRLRDDRDRVREHLSKALEGHRMNVELAKAFGVDTTWSKGSEQRAVEIMTMLARDAAGQYVTPTN